MHINCDISLFSPILSHVVLLHISPLAYQSRYHQNPLWHYSYPALWTNKLYVQVCTKFPLLSLSSYFTKFLKIIQYLKKNYSTFTELLVLTLSTLFLIDPNSLMILR